ncbi:unnamed protein product [Staurois parvus]|uniref:Uncharacterized protein n=1 Tax=Staurois parvus TaxID=386267 RepID=A0ABN9G0D9_9NEOB|nr:unnamed protein product [Staurois parvus]
MDIARGPGVSRGPVRGSLSSDRCCVGVLECRWGHRGPHYLLLPGGPMSCQSVPDRNMITIIL